MKITIEKTPQGSIVTLEDGSFDTTGHYGIIRTNRILNHYYRKIPKQEEALAQLVQDLIVWSEWKGIHLPTILLQEFGHISKWVKTDQPS